MFRKTIFASALFAIAILAIPQAATAQVSRVPGSGCRGAAYPSPTGSPALGQGFGISCPPCRAGHIPFVVIGTNAINFPLNAPIACTSTPCVLYPRPDILLPGSSAWRFVIPRDPRLIGFCFGIQCGCIDRTNNCLTLSGALKVCITR